jgi:hypothetical protein
VQVVDLVELVDVGGVGFSSFFALFSRLLSRKFLVKLACSTALFAHSVNTNFSSFSTFFALVTTEHASKRHHILLSSITWKDR